MAKRDPYDYVLPPHRRLWFLIMTIVRKRNARRVNATCNECGYRGIRTRRGKWCPSCYEDQNGELIRDDR